MLKQKHEKTTATIILYNIPNPAVTSCRKRKNNENATFLEDIKDHMDEFINASMDEYKTCFRKTMHKMFGMSKIVAQRNATDPKEVESSLPLQTILSAE